MPFVTCYHPIQHMSHHHPTSECMLHSLSKARAMVLEVVLGLQLVSCCTQKNTIMNVQAAVDATVTPPWQGPTHPQTQGPKAMDGVSCTKDNATHPHSKAAMIDALHCNLAAVFPHAKTDCKVEAICSNHYMATYVALHCILPPSCQAMAHNKKAAH